MLDHATARSAVRDCSAATAAAGSPTVTSEPARLVRSRPARERYLSGTSLPAIESSPVTASDLPAAPFVLRKPTRNALCVSCHEAASALPARPANASRKSKVLRGTNILPRRWGTRCRLNADWQRKVHSGAFLTYITAMMLPLLTGP